MVERIEDPQEVQVEDRVNSSSYGGLSWGLAVYQFLSDRRGVEGRWGAQNAMAEASLLT